MSIKNWIQAFVIALTFVVVGCNPSSSDGGGDSGGGSSTRIAGSVTLSSSVAGSNKPIDAMQKSYSEILQYKMTPNQGVVVLNKPSLNTGLSAVTLMNVGDPVGDAWVYLYDAEHPEWLAPVAQDITNSSGEYEFSVYGCTSDVSNSDCAADAAANGDVYADGDSLPLGIYTMLVYKPSRFDPILGVTTDPIVSVLPAFKVDSDEIAVGEAEAEVSDATPSVVSMFGLEKNTDGTDTWGSDLNEIPTNAALQISFDMAMSRGSVQNIEVANGSSVSGNWSLSPDWMTATFEPDADLSAGVYTVTVPSSTVNVYSNAMGYTAEGTFLATSVDSTAPTVSISPANNSTAVPATAPIRLTSDEVLNINALRIDSAPSIGDFPGIILVDSDGTNFVYEVMTTESLTLGTDYSMTFSGLEDGAGNAAADIPLAFSTEAAADAEGVDSTANADTQNAQVAISEIFAKWVRGINERNSATISSLMSGSFVFEYSVQAEDGFRDEDVNRNGRLSLKEFTSMIEHGMVHWEFCETTVTGEVVGNVALESADAGSFEFILNFESVNQSQDCGDDGGESIYATVKNVNGLWKLARMSEGFDHRGTTVSSLSLIEAQLYEVADNAEGEQLVANWDQLTHFADNQTPFTFKFEHVTGVESYVFLLANERDPAKLGFAFVVSADRLACGDDSQCSAAEGDALELSIPDPFGNDGMPTGAYPVLEFFGFDSDRDWGIENPGEVFLWEVIGLGSISSQELASENAPSIVDVVRDIEAVSAVKRFQNPGEYVELIIDVAMVDSFGADTLPGGGDDVTTALEYNIYNSGYDAFAADWVQVTVTSPDADSALGEAYFYAHSSIGFGEYPVTFTTNGDGTSSATATIELFNGWTWAEVGNGLNRYEHFQVVTTGGRQPDVEVTGGTIDGVTATPTVHTLSLDEWNFVDGSSDATGGLGVDEIDLTWTLAAGDGVGGQFDIDDVIELLTDSLNGGTNACSPGVGWADMDVYVGNNDGAYHNVRFCTDDGQGNRTPSGDILISGSTISLAADLPVFTGDNWVSLNIWGDSGDGTSWYDTHSSFGVYTDAGTLFVPAISLVSIETTEGALGENGNWGQGSDWEATDVTTATSDVTIVVEFKQDPAAPRYWAGADGIGGESVDMRAPDLFTTATQASITVTLYRGYNWVQIEDGDGNWYNVNIYTENGAEVPKPKILTANGITIPEPADHYATLEIVVDTCTVTVAGTAPENTERMFVNWSGGNNTEGNWEGQEILLPGDTGSLQDWDATFQLVSGANTYNSIDVYDETNQAGTWANVTSTAANCVYSAPVMTVDGVRLGDATELEPANPEDMYSSWGLANVSPDMVDPVTDTSVIVYGTTTVPGRFIGINSYLCGSEVKVGAQASTTEVSTGSGTYAWEIEVPLYDDNLATVDYTTVYPFNQNLGIHDGINHMNVNVMSDSNQEPPAPAMTVTTPALSWDSVQDNCGYTSWDGTTMAESLMSITLSGNTTNVSDGFGQVYYADGWMDFPIDSAGDFTVTVSLYDGYNNLNIDDGHGGYFSVDIQTANGNLPPQYVFITSHSTLDIDVANDVTSGVVTIEGDFFDTSAGSDVFAPDWMYGYVQVCDADYVSCVYTNYDSNLTVMSEFGDMPMSFDPQNPAAGFSLNADVPDATYQVYVDVYGCGAEGCHGRSFYMNDDGYDDDYFYKPGGSSQAPAAFHHRSEAMR